ncbi:MAG: hypothetical protein IPN62_16580 [Flavobacteriales bacterium]|nr:hypothetical protein [Flavobacteriales bacterium]
MKKILLLALLLTGCAEPKGSTEPLVLFSTINGMAMFELDGSRIMVAGVHEMRIKPIEPKGCYKVTVYYINNGDMHLTPNKFCTEGAE